MAKKEKLNKENKPETNLEGKNNSTGFNPLEGDTIQRDYSAPQILEAMDIPEPIFIPPAIGEHIKEEPTPRPKKTNNPVFEQEPIQQPRPNSFEPDNSFSSQSKQVNSDDFDSFLDDASSEELAEMIVDAYVTLKSDGVYMILEISEERLMKKSLKGKFNMDFLNVKIPIDENRLISYKEYIDDYNKGIKEALLTPKETKKKLKELLSKILEKRDVKITPEQSLIYYFAKDVLMTSGKVAQQIQINNTILNYIQEVYHTQKGEISKLKAENERLKQQATQDLSNTTEKKEKFTKKEEKITDAQVIVNEVQEPEEK